MVIHSKLTLSATEFYDQCDLYNRGKDKGITIADCSPSRNHSRTTLNEKSSCCADMLRIQDAKYMKVGLKDKISQYVDFAYGYGNMATLGFERRRDIDMSFPITLIPRNIDEFATRKFKIAFVLEKRIADQKYKRMIVEVKEGLFAELCREFPEKLREIIDV